MTDEIDDALGGLDKTLARLNADEFSREQAVHESLKACLASTRAGLTQLCKRLDEFDSEGLRVAASALNTTARLLVAHAENLETRDGSR